MSYAKARLRGVLMEPRWTAPEVPGELPRLDAVLEVVSRWTAPGGEELERRTRWPITGRGGRAGANGLAGLLGAELVVVGTLRMSPEGRTWIEVERWALAAGVREADPGRRWEADDLLAEFTTLNPRRRRP